MGHEAAYEQQVHGTVSHDRVGDRNVAVVGVARGAQVSTRPAATTYTATPRIQTTTAAAPDHQIFAAATAGVISTHAIDALMSAPLTLVSENLSPNDMKGIYSDCRRRLHQSATKLALFKVAATCSVQGIERVRDHRTGRSATSSGRSWA